MNLETRDMMWQRFWVDNYWDVDADVASNLRAFRRWWFEEDAA